jgi:hypothetical protein
MANTSVLTAKGREILVGRCLGATPAQPEPKYIGLDLNPANLTAAATDVAPFAPAAEALVAATEAVVATTTANDTLQLTATVTLGTNETIGGSYVTDASAKPYSTTVTGGTAVGSNSATGLTVAANYTPANGTDLQVRTEVVTVTAGTGTTNLTVTRAANGSAAISTIANADVATAGNAPGQSGVTNGSLFIHSSWPAGLALLSGESLTIVQTLKIT